MNKRRYVSLLSVLILALAALTLYLYIRYYRPDHSQTAQRVSHNLQQQLKSSAPVVAASRLANVPQKTISLRNNSIEPTLDRDELRKLRATYSRTRFNPGAKNERDGRTVMLAGRRISVDETDALPDFHNSPQIPTRRDTKPYIVYVGEPITAAIRQQLQKQGVILRGYLPDFAFLTELSADSLTRLESCAAARFVTEYTADDKLEPFIKALTEIRQPSDSLRISIQTLDPNDLADISNEIENSGGTIETVNALPEWGMIRAIVSLAEIRELANLGAVQWIEEHVPVTKLNDFAAAPAHLNASGAWHSWHLSGADQIVGHGDTGVDTGNPDTIKADFQGQIAAIYDLANGGTDAADYDGHGTHTAGSICCNGALSNGEYRGIAHNAKLVVQALVDKSSGSFTGINDLYGMYMQSYLAGATIHSDSWGADYYGEYDSMARITDLFSWTYKDFLPVFAAGNSGADLNNDGVVDVDSITSPGTAKNVLTVGATENDRPFAMEGYRAATYGSKWYSTYKTNPIKDDRISWSAATNPYQQGMAAFSSRGPTDDSRLKPEVCAPGTDVISTRSTISGTTTLWGILPSNQAYCYGGGTSMATPLAAGAAALIREYVVKRAGIISPTAALIKAAMIGGTRSLAPGQYGTGSTQEIPFARPDNVEGWGQTDVEHAVHPDGMMIRLIDRIELQSNQTNSYAITVEKPGYPLDIIMCWADYPGTAGAAVTLINDLNLSLRDPAGNTVFPNGKDQSDNRNTVEGIHIASATAGTYSINISGYNVPVSGVQAALYIRGAVDEPPIIVHQAQPFYNATLAPYPIDFNVQSLNVFTNNELNLHFNTGTSAGVTGIWQSVQAEWCSNVCYRAFIPHHAPDTTLYYYITLSDHSYNLELPQNAVASNSFYRMHLGAPTELSVFGQPQEYGVVSPSYGTNLLLSGETFTASALPQNISATERLAANNWSGSGDIPSSGTSNPFSQSIHQNSTLTWHWHTQYTLQRDIYLRSVDYLLTDNISWYWKDGVVPNQWTPEVLQVSGLNYSQLYAFYGWSIDDSRWPDNHSPTPNPLNSLVMSNALVLQANYMELGTDVDDDNLYDWWELRFFGTTNAAVELESDPDNDGWSNLAESLDNTNPHDPSSYPTPPGIDVVPLHPFQSDRPPWRVTADVTDNFLIFTVILEWREKGETAWRQVEMNYSQENLFSALISPPSHGAIRVDYRVIAYDIVGYYDNSFISSSPIYSVIGDYDTPWLAVTPATLSLYEVAIQPTNLTCTVANLAGADLVWSACVASAVHTFSAGDPAWRHSGTNDFWSVTTQRTWNGEPVWYCGNTNNYRYPDLCHASLDTPPFTVGNNGILLFRHWMRFEKYGPDKPRHYWDGAVLRISTDNGLSFTGIEPVNGYNALIEPNPDSPFSADMPCLGDTGTGDWRTTMIDLAQFTGQTVIVRFEFGSDRYTVDEGWYVGGVTLLDTDIALPPWLTPTGSWSGVLPDLWSDSLSLQIDPAPMLANSEHALCLRFSGNDPQNEPIVDLTLRRGFAVTAQTTGNGYVNIPDPVIFRDESAVIDVQANYGSYITNIAINGVGQPGDYNFEDTSRFYTINPVADNLMFTIDFALRTWNLQTISAHGTPLPAASCYTVPHGSSVVASVETAVYDLDPDIRYDADGFILSGVAPLSYDLATVTLTLTNNAAITWRWCTNYQMHAFSNGHGVVVPSAGWYTAGSEACTTGYPALYYHFSHWAGDTDGSTNVANTIMLPMHAPATLVANFSANLTPTHGVPEPWLADQGYFDDFEAAAESDQDGDGMATWREWRADTDPNNDISLLQLSSITLHNEWMDIEWTGGIMRTQMLQSAATPAGPWISLYTNLPPAAISNAISLPRTGEHRFFRIAIP
jgi:hypothetical protein